MTKLQLALDAISLEQALELVASVAPYIDIIEAGTPFVLENGMEAVRRLKRNFPAKEILCDGKIMDAGAYETEEMLRAGAEWITVMALTDDATIRECVETAHKKNARVMADMLCVRDVAERVAFLESAGVDCIAVHTGVDQQHRGQTPLDDLRRLRECVQTAQVAVAGGISADNVNEYLALSPDILIVGGGILSQKDPTKAAAEIRAWINADDKTRK